MTHYVCPGCGNVSESPGACETNGCNMLGQNMSECNCSDALHGDIMNKATI